MRACVAAGEHRRWVVDDDGRQVPDSPSLAAARSGLATAGTARPVPVSWLAQVERAPEADVMSFIDRRRTPVSQIGNDETEPATELQCVSATRRLAEAFRHAYRRITLL